MRSSPRKSRDWSTACSTGWHTICGPRRWGVPVAAKPLGEFARIARFFAPLALPGGLALRDDVALIAGRHGEQYVLKADAIVEGIHFFPDDPPGDVARKLLRVNLSDLAAKGATPVGYLLTMALPKARDDRWLAAFARGLAADQRKYRLGLFGGDSDATRGPTVLSLAAIGRVAKGRAVLRSGARPGDVVYVSGTLGDAALGLAVITGRLKGIGPAARRYLARRYRLPEPRLELGRRLAGVARAAADISDGLVADLGHVCAASGVGAIVEAARVPLSVAAHQVIARSPRRIRAALIHGDDYELVFTAPAAAAARVAAAARAAGVRVTAVGRVVEGHAVRVLDARGRAMRFGRTGYRHF
ncbi:MAG: thiamine-phosphate kinase [Alphaproteobacteria bacterium]|nr:thiamine-phosphate kinase [Alphaproteobacteria bacterium]